MENKKNGHYYSITVMTADEFPAVTLPPVMFPVILSPVVIVMLSWATTGVMVAKLTTDAAVANTVTIETAAKNIFKFINRW